LRRRGLWVQFGWYGFDSHLRQIGRQFAPLAVGSVIMSSTVLVDQYYAAMLPAGSVATLNYGIRLVSFILAFVTATLGTALFPYYSRLAAKEDWAGLRSLLLRYVGLSLAVAIPLTAVMFLASELLVTLMYQRGAFTAEDARLVSEVQRLYVLQTPFYIAAILCVRLVSALRHNTVLMIGAIGNLAVNIAANTLLAPRMGVAGIALAAVCVYTFSFTFLFLSSLWFLRRKTSHALLATP
jgi:putative peptidoglycan lipid II flippase